MTKLNLVTGLLATAGVALVLTLSGCGEKKDAADVAANPVIVIGASPVPHVDILKVAQDELKKEGVELKIVEFSDYVKPNLALQDKELDANFFQHLPYLKEFCQAHGCKLESLVAVHLEPMGVYSTKVKDLKDLADGATVAIPNDPTNGGRALKVLEHAGLLKVNPEAGALASAKDITENPKGLKIRELEAAQLPRSLDDVDAAVINSNYALGARLNPVKDALATESKESPYANIVTVREGDNRPALQKLKNALTSPAVKAFIEKQYDGAVVPAF